MIEGFWLVSFLSKPGLFNAVIFFLIAVMFVKKRQHGLRGHRILVDGRKGICVALRAS
ncbi:hypothetical protein [Pseudarthrobacter sp. AB1]|uniref:hypothetical protein n=1 Tax=Pseudarthrobacter sp. AB1 TaxID=2138309 RepID=UPI00186BA4C8|nr:hypothetical protein [Pseudarthrobacter sp. AB1]